MHSICMIRIVRMFALAGHYPIIFSIAQIHILNHKLATHGAKSEVCHRRVPE